MPLIRHSEMPLCRVAHVRQAGFLPLPFLANSASVSVVLSCVSFERFSPWKSTQRLLGLPPSGRSLGGSSLGRKLFRLAAALSACRQR